MARYQMVFDDASGDQMFLDDPFEHRGIARGIPGALGIDHGDRAAFADTQAVRLGAQNAALLGKSQLLQAAFQKVPRREAAILLAALRIRLVAAEEDVAPRDGHANRFRDAALRISGQQPSAPTLRTLQDPTADRVRSAAPCSR